MTKEEIKNKIIRLIEFYKDEIEDSKDFLENSMEDGETNTAVETSMFHMEEFIGQLETLKKYCDEE
jgi:hypothetical protein